MNKHAIQPTDDIFISDINVAEMAALRQMCQSEGWRVLMEKASEKAVKAFGVALDPTQGQAERDIACAGFDVHAWYLALSDRLNAADELEPPIPEVAAEEVEDGESTPKSIPKARECVFNRWRVGLG